MEFVAEKDASGIPFVLSLILDSCINGITLSDPDQEDNPLVYANEAFELVTVVALEKSAVMSQDVLPTVTRDQLESLVGIDKRIVLLVGIGERYPVDAAIEDL